MTVIYEPKETIYDGFPDWERRTVAAHTPFIHNDREFKGQEFTIEKSQYGVEIEFQTGDGDFSRGFTSEEFEEFIRQCQWVSQCKVKQKND